jgi:hypothetical protein
MKLPPAWKVKREIWRLKEQVGDLLVPRISDRIGQARHDRNIAHLLRETRGALSLSPRVAVFVLFQPRGIAPSTFFTLDHLAREGWSVLVISNAPLSDSDRSQLAAKSAHVIERPNTGYDFGAYREGWRWLDRHGHRPDRLILMNDSSWFPLRMNDDSLRRMEALDVDLAGHILKSEMANDPSHDHVESHLLMIGPEGLRHPVFRGFWDSFVMSNDKRRTIANGEKGLTQTLRAAGMRVRGLLDADDMIAHLSSLSPKSLEAVVRRLALHTVETRTWRENLLMCANQGGSWIEDALAWAQHELANSRQILLSAAFVDVAISDCSLAFVKKSSDVRFQLARLALLRAVSEGRLTHIDPIVLSEIEKTCADWKLPFDWRAKPFDIQITEL